MMQGRLYIRQIAVLGAGVMGAQIAAHCVNAGYKTLLFDLASDVGPRNGLIESAVKKLGYLNPSPLAFKDANQWIEICNYEDDLTRLTECDLVIEAIAERLDWKHALYERVIPFLSEVAYLVTNTSGLSINDLAKHLPKQLQKRFCGVHFFNPPRYMHLVELIPSVYTSPDVLDSLETWLTSFLGKGVVRAKDTPNFIANRVGVFSLLATLHHAQQFNLSPAKVDALTGLLIGRPKSATYRTLDIVGLDTMLHVVNTMKDKLTACPWHKYYELPSWIMKLIEKKALGQKSGEGIYRKKGHLIEVYDSKKNRYGVENETISPEILSIFNRHDIKEQMSALFASTHVEAQFLKACFLDLFHYTVYVLPEIAQTVQDVDNAMCWGFGWTQGPLLLWQKAGFSQILEALEHAYAKHALMATVPVPIWLHGIREFYQEPGSYNPSTYEFEKTSILPVYQKQHLSQVTFSKPKLYENEAIKLWSIEDGICGAQFKTRGNTLDMAVIEGLNEALTLATEKAQSLILYQDDQVNFCLGANLAVVGQLAAQRHYEAIERLIQGFQDVLMRIKFSPIPVISALRGRALGGGAELLLHCAKTIAHIDSYVGLVELGVGLIPAGGGCKAFAQKAAAQQVSSDLLVYLLPYFNQILHAEVSMSAWDARRRGFLKSADRWVMHSNEVLFTAVKEAKAMIAGNYMPPLESLFKVAGLEGAARLTGRLLNLYEGQFITEYDYRLAKSMAEVMCGGEVNANTLVSESWLLRLERETFMQWIQEEKTLARIEHMLTTGKPLRN